MRRIGLFIVVFALLGCTTVWHFTPPDAPSKSTVNGWPKNLVTVAVKDLRPTKEDSEAVVGAVHTAVLNILSEPRPGSDQYRMEIRILAYRAAFETGIPYWNGATALQVKVTDSAGAIRKEWDIIATTSKWNWWGYWTAKAAARESFETAMADLRHRMAHDPLIQEQ